MRVEELKQTVFITKENKNLVRFSFPEGEYTPGNRFCVKIVVGGKTALEEECFDRINEVFLPLVDKDTPACLIVTQEGESPVKFPFILKKVKKWTIGFIVSSHEDLGYCSWVNKLGKECADYTNAALDLMEKDSGYKYVTEHYWWQKGFEDYSTKEQKDRFVKCLRSGKMEINAPQTSNHTHWQSEEVLIRSLYPSFGQLNKRYGITPKTAFYADISGITWGAVNAYSHTGIKFAGIAENQYLRFTTDDEELPQLFWWMAPNQKDRLLCIHQNGYRPTILSKVICDTKRQYRENDFIFDETKANRTVCAVDSMIDNLGDVQYDLFPCVFYDDHEYPTAMLLKVCGGMNSKWKYPVFKFSTFEESLSYIEEHFGDTLPVKSGDWSEQWADFATIAPEWMAKMRAAQRLLPVAETLSTIAAFKDKKEYPQSKIADSVWRLCEFDDHCWATSSKHPQEMHKFNLNLVKKESADFAYSKLSGIIKNILKEPSEDSCPLQIWNLLPQKRKMSLTYEGDYAIANVACQKLPNGKLITEPLELPACGFEIYQKDSPNQITCFEEMGDSCFETDFYKVECDKETQKVLSIVEKETGREFIDRNSSYGLGEFLYINTETKHEKGFNVEHAQSRTFKIYKGELATVICMTAYEEQLAANIHIQITFYEKEKNIDIECGFKNAVGLMGDYYDRYKKNIFWAFPLSVPSHHFRTEIVGGIVDERTQRLPKNPHDFVCANNWVAAQNDEGGIAVYSRDMPIFHLGDIHYNEISSKVDFSNSSNVFLYAASNRCNNLNFVSKEDCQAIYSVSLLPYQGDCAKVIPIWCDAKRTPPVLAAGDTGNKTYSFMEVDCNHIRLSTCKLAENNNNRFVLRFVETGGEKETARLRLPKGVESVCYADGAEISCGDPIPIDNHMIEFEVEAFSYVTLLLTMNSCFEVTTEEPDNHPIKNIFAFEFESEKTLICFEKNTLDSIETIEVYADGVLADTVKPDNYYIQFLVLERINISEIELMTHLKDGGAFQCKWERK